jgi:DNA-binding transcriptional MerR regulator
VVKDGFTAGEVIRIVGISYWQLDHWDRSGFIKPSLEGASGKGSERQYNFLDLVQLRVAKMLRDSGVSLGRTKKGLGGC